MLSRHHTRQKATQESYGAEPQLQTAVQCLYGPFLQLPQPSEGHHSELAVINVTMRFSCRE